MGKFHGSCVVLLGRSQSLLHLSFAYGETLSP